jgi:hypothetical protein
VGLLVLVPVLNCSLRVVLMILCPVSSHARGSSNSVSAWWQCPFFYPECIKNELRINISDQKNSSCRVGLHWLQPWKSTRGEDDKVVSLTINVTAEYLFYVLYLRK